jgi:hypothetical protein
MTSKNTNKKETTKNVKPVTDNKKAVAKTRATLLELASKHFDDISVFDTSTNDEIKKAIADITKINASETTKKDKKPEIKNLLGGVLKKSGCKSDYVIDFVLKSGDIITQKLGFGGFNADKNNEQSLQKHVDGGDLLTDMIVKQCKTVTDVLYNKSDNHLYFFTNGAYGVDSDHLINAQNGFWLTNLATIPSTDLIKSVQIRQK